MNRDPRHDPRRPSRGCLVEAWLIGGLYALSWLGAALAAVAIWWAGDRP